MPNFAFIVKDGKLGIAQGTLMAVDKREAMEALRGHDVLDVQELGPRPAALALKRQAAAGSVQSGLVFMMSFGLTLLLLMHLLARPIPADFLARDCKWLAFLATAATVCVRLLGRRSAGLDSRAAAGGAAGETIARTAELALPTAAR